MIANNSAGARSVVHGLTADHVLALGRDAGRRHPGHPAPRRARAPPRSRAPAPSADAARPPALVRRVSGYALDALAGDGARLAAPALRLGGHAGRHPPRRAAARRAPGRRAGWRWCRFPSVDAALEAVVGLLEAGPSAIELMDRALLDPANRPPAVRAADGLRRRDAAALLVVEHSGDAGRGRATALAGDRRAPGSCSTPPSRRPCGPCAARASRAPCGAAPAPRATRGRCRSSRTRPCRPSALAGFARAVRGRARARGRPGRLVRPRQRGLPAHPAR